MDLIRTQRIALSAVFFQSGICFSTWASRIPDIKQSFQLADATLGALLLIKPLGSFIGLPLSGWFVDKYGSRKAVLLAMLTYSLCLTFIASATTIYWLAASLLLFGMAGNLANVSLNTQALAIEHAYGRVVMASFHGLWSIAGLTGGAVGALMLTLNINVFEHFVFTTIVIMVLVLASYRFLNKDNIHQGAGGFVFKKPDSQLFKLGVVAFCGMMCEGCMFDWSGVYFKQVIGAKDGMVAAGFISFMAMMAAGRFVSDYLTNKYGSHTILQGSGVLIFAGLLTAVLFPYFITGILGFFLVGAGTSSVIPLTFSEVGKTKKTSTGLAIAMVATIGYFGFLLGPPVIGFIADILNLRASFALIALAGLSITILITYRKIKERVVLTTSK